MKIHKSGCMANISCLAYHADGICPGPYGKCICNEMTEKPQESTKIEPGGISSIEEINSLTNHKHK